jgi:hypothetical protein
VPALAVSSSSPTAADTTTSSEGFPTTNEPFPTTSPPPQTTLPPPILTTIGPATTAKPSATTRPTARSTTTARRVTTTTNTTTAAAPVPGPGPPLPNVKKLLGDGAAGKVAGTGITPPLLKADDVLADLPKMRATGLNTAAVDVFWFADSITASSVHPGPTTPSDEQLDRVIAAARAVGMRVVLTPKVMCPTCKRAPWRGILTPKDKARFFESYGQMIDKYAALAERDHVWLFFIGSEWNRIQDQADRWREISARARRSFHGVIGYEVNWDVFNQVTFWDAVDVVGVSAYFPLSEAEHPTVRDLMAGWRQSASAKFNGQTWVADLRQLARDTGKPILFGELGYPALTHVGREPFEPNPKHEARDDEGQATAFQAALATFEPESWWLGAVWWQWQDPTPYAFRGKPAQALLARWYVDGVRPEGSAPIGLDPPAKAYRPPAIVTGVSRKYRVLSALAMILAMMAWTAWLLIATATARARRGRRFRPAVAQAATGPAPLGGLTVGDGRQTPSRWSATSTQNDGFENR